jgi:hypothetical protein
MALINEVYVFGENGTVSAGDVMSNGGYLVDAQRLTGHQAGIARRELENTALRNVSRFCRGVAQFIAEGYAPGVVDDGDADKIVAGMESAVNGLIGLHNVSAEAHADIRALIAAISMPGQATETVAGIMEIATTAEAQGWADDARALTPLKQAQSLQGSNQSLSAAGGYQKFPGGLILQWGLGSVADGVGYADITFPIAFPTACLRMVACDNSAAGGLANTDFVSVASTLTLSGVRVYSANYDGTTTGTNGFSWIAIGH